MTDRDPQSASALLNRHFACIRVDRGEPPDADRPYTAAPRAVQALGSLPGRGGWLAEAGRSFEYHRRRLAAAPWAMPRISRPSPRLSRRERGRAAACVCVVRACRPPVTEVQAFAALLEGVS